jgi:hypothetical protein
LELTDEQTTQIDSIIAEHQEATKKYADEHGKAMRELRERMRQAVQSGEKPEGLREELKAIQTKAPKFDDAQKQIWELLNPEQQAALKVKLEELRKKLGANQPGRGEAKDRARGGSMPSSPERERYERQRAGKSGGAPGTRGSGPQGGSEGKPPQ